MDLDYRLIGDGIVVTDDRLTLIMDGTFRSLLHDGIHHMDANEEHEYSTPLPLYVEGRGPAQIIVSEYSMNTLLEAAFELNWFDFEKTMNGDALANYLAGFDQAYGSYTEAVIKATPVKGSNSLTISDHKGKTTMNCLIDMHIKNPYADDKDMNAVYL